MASDGMVPTPTWQVGTGTEYAQVLYTNVPPLLSFSLYSIWFNALSVSYTSWSLSSRAQWFNCRTNHT